MRCKRSRGSAHGSERVLAALPWRAIYWECPALTPASLSDPFECVALEAPSLIGLTAEPDAFRAHLDAAPPGSLVAVFPNLGGDAILVAPTEGGDRRGYPHLAAFLRAAPQAQIAAFFSALASQGLALMPGRACMGQHGWRWRGVAARPRGQAAKVLPLCAISRGAALKSAGELCRLPGGQKIRKNDLRKTESVL